MGKRRDAQDLIRTLFKDDKGQPFVATDSQADIFNTIFLREYPRNQIISATRYGKSSTVAKALVCRATSFREAWTITAGSQRIVDVIMGQVIERLFDNPYLLQQIDLDGIGRLERLKHERSKDKLTFIGGGEIRTLTADARNKARTKEVLIGQGAQNLVADEASLVHDELMAMMMRMLGDQPDNYLLKIGNPFLRNHFYRSWNNPNFHTLKIDYKIGLAEGRYSQEYIDEMRKEPFFDVLYECEFPERERFLAGGYQLLISEEELEEAFVTDDPALQKERGYPPVPEIKGDIWLGSDFAGGGNDSSAYVLRSENLMWLHSKNDLENVIDQADIIVGIRNDHDLDTTRISTDKGGLGQGVGDYLKRELNFYCNNIMFGEAAQNKLQFKNRRAEMYYRLAQWIKDGGKIIYDETFYELLVIAYKTDTERKFQIQPKEDLKKRMADAGIEASSPDVADASALTFPNATVSGNRFFTF